MVYIRLTKKFRGIDKKPMFYSALIILDNRLKWYQIVNFIFIKTHIFQPNYKS